ncbi:MAG: hypothetical protein MZV70_41180 [Desulfobacterales bacterium]|nr:hypothetical protein [Desulfobacterales bacterium]
MKKIIVGFSPSARILAVAFSAFAKPGGSCCGLPVKQSAVAGAGCRQRRQDMPTANTAA